MTGSASSTIMRALTNEWQSSVNISDSQSEHELAFIGWTLLDLAKEGKIERRKVGLSSEYRLRQAEGLK